MDINYVLLLDIYGEILPKSQRAALDLRYNSDLSLSEIAEEMGGISRQSVNDFLRKGEKRLLELERLLGNAARFRAVSGELDKARAILAEMRSGRGDECLNALEAAFLRIQAEMNG